MSLWTYLKSIYSLDTLDVRFSASSSASRSVGSRHGTAAKAQPALWNTAEFYFYLIFIAICVPMMVKTAHDVSQPSHPNWKNYEHLLSPGWIPGRRVDNSDAQYAGFRDNLPYIFLLLIIHPLIRRFFDSVVKVPKVPVSATLSTVIAAKSRFEQRIAFDRYFALVFLVALHGVSATKIFLILYVNYSIAHRLPRDYVPAATWIFNLTILFANELCQGYPFAAIAELLLPLSARGEGKNWGSYLDELGGLMPRWEVLFKITVLRLISYNMDYYWSRAGGESSSLEKKQLDPATLSERERVSIPADAANFNFRTYLSYTLYSPLYLAGPILTFNDYVSQCHYPLSHLTGRRVFKYGLRFILSLLCMEVFIHYIYAVAISKDTPDWSIYTPGQLSILGYFNLHHIWLKLLLPWRFFRLWSLADGLDPPENMVRCVSDNYSPGAFWRGWHRSFNRWVVRYVYVPLGGSGQGPEARSVLGGLRSGFNLLAVFSFVAIWHDINLRLLIWGWMIVFFIAPEKLASLTFPKRKWENNRTTYRLLCGLGAVGNILMMMAANLVGFAVGLDGLKSMIVGIVGSVSGILYLLVACSALFIGSQVMFEIREEELRQGINLKC